MTRTELKKSLLLAGIGALVLSVFVSVSIVLFGSFGELQTKFLLSTFTIGWYSLAASMSFEFQNRKLIPLTFVGIIISIIGATLTLHLIWSDFDWVDNNKGNAVMIFFIVSFSLAHSSMLLKALSSSAWVKGVVFTTIGFAAVVGLMLIQLVLDQKIESEYFFRFLIALAILDAAGSIATPIVKKLS